MVSMPHPHITSLYKYCPIDKDGAIKRYALEGLRNGKLWASQPNSFNDPFDCNTDNYDPETIAPRTIEIFSQSGLDNIDFNDPSNIRKVKKLLHAQFVAMAKKYGVLCLTENCESILMWSHYADGHRGFCMEFERTGDGALVDFEILRPVSYTRDCPNIDLDKLMDESNVPAFIRELSTFVLAKAEGWGYENEWRGIYRLGNRLVDYPGKLKSIIWGINTSSEHKSTIKDSVKDSTVVFRQARRVPKEFRIAIEAEEI